VSVVVEFAPASTVSDVGLKAHVAPMGRKPEHAKPIVPLKAAFAVIVSVTVPVPPAVAVTVESEEVIVRAGAGSVMV
jgi:hypothetical protein